MQMCLWGEWGMPQWNDELFRTFLIGSPCPSTIYIILAYYHLSWLKQPEAARQLEEMCCTLS